MFMQFALPLRALQGFLGFGNEVFIIAKKKFNGNAN